MAPVIVVVMLLGGVGEEAAGPTHSVAPSPVPAFPEATDMHRLTMPMDLAPGAAGAVGTGAGQVDDVEAGLGDIGGSEDPDWPRAVGIGGAQGAGEGRAGAASADAAAVTASGHHYNRPWPETGTRAPVHLNW